MPDVVAERDHLRVVVDESFDMESPEDDGGPARIVVVETEDGGINVMASQNTVGINDYKIADLFLDAEKDDDLFADAVTEELEEVAEVVVNIWDGPADEYGWELVIRPEGVAEDEDLTDDSDLVLWVTGDYKNLILQSKKTYRNIQDPSDNLEVWSRVESSGPVYGADEDELLAVAEDMISEHLDR